jgi:hypothetical protein
MGRNLFKTFYRVILAIVIFSDFAFSQATNVLVVKDNSVANYSVAPTQTLYVFSGCTYTGNIYLKGGSLINNGSLDKVDIYSGTIINNGVIKNANHKVLSLDGSLRIFSNSGSSLTFKDSVKVSAGSNDSIYFNLQQGSITNFTKDFILNSGKLIVKVGTAGTSTTNISALGSLNINGNASFASTLIIDNSSAGVININKSLTLKNGGQKLITNMGKVNISGNVSVSGNSSSVSLVNHKVLGIHRSLKVSGTSQMILTNFNAKGNIQIGDSLLLASSTLSFTNKGLIKVNRLASVESALLINDGVIRCGSMKVAAAAITNNNRVVVQKNLEISDSSSKFINKKVLQVKKHLTNNGTLEGGKKSLIVTGSFSNLNASAKLKGPTDLTVSGTTSVDSSNYAVLYIDSLSRNSGAISGYNMILDQTYTGTSAKKMDQVDDPTLISMESSFRGRCVSLEIGQFTIYPEKTVYCPGDDIYISFDNYVSVQHIDWTYSGTAGGYDESDFQFDIIDVATGGTVTICGEYWDGSQWCPFCIDVVIIAVGGPSVSATSPVYSAVGNTVTLNCTPSGGASPYTFNWQPNYYFVAPSDNQDEDPVVSPKVSLTYTVLVTDANGCTATTTVQVILKPFAVFDKKLNGEYYTLFNNKLFFKYDAQYSNTTLVYRVYDLDNKDVSVNSPFAPVNITTVVPGDNRYTLDATNLATGAYVLEVVNEKKEKLFLRFKK